VSVASRLFIALRKDCVAVATAPSTSNAATWNMPPSVRFRRSVQPSFPFAAVPLNSTFEPLTFASAPGTAMSGKKSFRRESQVAGRVSGTTEMSAV